MTNNATPTRIIDNALANGQLLVLVNVSVITTGITRTPPPKSAGVTYDANETTNVINTPAVIPGSASGTNTRVNTVMRFAPRFRAASSSSRGIVCMTLMIGNTMNGNITCESPMMIPVSLNNSCGVFSAETSPSSTSVELITPLPFNRMNQPNERTTRSIVNGASVATTISLPANPPFLTAAYASGKPRIKSIAVTAAAIHAIPCSTDFESLRMELDLHSIEDPGLQQEVGEFQRQCFGPARNRLLQEGGTIEATRAMDVDWIGSNYFQTTPGYYDSFYAGRPIAGFPYDADRDVSRPNTGPGLPGYPSCQEWWSAENVGLSSRLHDEVSTGFWDDFRSVFTSSDAEDYVIRRLVSPRSGAASGNLDQAVVGFRGLDGGSSFWDATVTAGSAIGGTLSILPFQAGMDMLKQALPMVQGILVMAIIICLPFVMVISSYSFKVAGMATFGLFAMWFLTFWWELARWINANLVDLLYRSDAAKLSWLSAANNLYDRMVLQFVEGMMFLVLPTLWVAVLGWSGMKVGDSLGRSVTQSTSPSQSAGQKGGSQTQASGSGGKLG